MIDKNKLVIAIEVNEAEKVKLLQRIAFIDEQIESYKQQLLRQANNPINPKQTSFTGHASPNGIYYDTKASWVDKVWFFINQEKRFVHSREIQEFLFTKEPNQDQKELQRRVGGALARLKKEKAVVNHKVGKTNLGFVWGTPYWLDSLDQIKKGYEYKPEYVEEKKSKRIFVYN